MIKREAGFLALECYYAREYAVKLYNEVFELLDLNDAQTVLISALIDAKIEAERAMFECGAAGISMDEVLELCKNNDRKDGAA